jgi:hypothetical protein
MEQRINELMTLLGCSEDEAKDIIETDKAIDRGERVYFDLDKEKEKEAIKMANVGTRKKPTVYDFSKRERKADTTKEGVIQQIADFLTENGYAAVEIVNKSKLITFKIGTDTYKLDLIRQRQPKK